jgi:hypothetical protein
VDNNLPICVVDGHGLGIAMSGSATRSARPWSRCSSRELHTLRPWLQPRVANSLFLAMRQTSRGKDDRRTESKMVGKYGLQGPKWGGQNLGFGHREDLHGLMRV